MMRIAVLCSVLCLLVVCTAAQNTCGTPPVVDPNMIWDCKRQGDNTTCTVSCPPGQDPTDEGFTVVTDVSCGPGQSWPFLACVRTVDGCNMTDQFPCPCILGEWGGWSKCVQNCSDPNLAGEMCRFRPIASPEYMDGGCPGARSQCRECTGAPDECQGPCKDVLCRNGGECLVSAENRAYCNCTKGAYGRYCETLDPCLENPCQNGATCTTRFTTPYCACPPGLTGDTCNRTITNVCDPNPCNNGTCNGDFGQAVCTCNDGFFGRWCAETAAPAPPAVATCNSTALVRCMSTAPVGDSFNKTCGRFQVYGQCAETSSCLSFANIWCAGLFKVEAGCDIPQCTTKNSSCDAVKFATCYEKMKATTYPSRCAYLTDYVKCGTISDCPDLMKTICTAKQVAECTLKQCPYTVPSASLVDADALTAVIGGEAREWVYGQEATEQRTEARSPLMFVGAVMIVAAAATVAVAIVARNRRLQGEYHQMGDVVTH